MGDIFCYLLSAYDIKAKLLKGDSDIFGRHREMTDYYLNGLWKKE
jgi:hypothetical protein